MAQAALHTHNSASNTITQISPPSEEEEETNFTS